MRSIIRGFALAITAEIAGACGGATTALPPDPTTGGHTPATAASVAIAGSTTLTVGSAARFVATVRDAAGNSLPNESVAWTSTATAIATVDASGLVTGLAAGSVSITARVA